MAGRTSQSQRPEKNGGKSRAVSRGFGVIRDPHCENVVREVEDFASPSFQRPPAARSAQMEALDNFVLQLHPGCTAKLDFTPVTRGHQRPASAGRSGSAIKSRGESFFRNHHALSSTADSDDIPRRPPVRVASPYGLRAGAHLPVQRATPPWRPAGSSSLYPHGVDIFRISASHGNPDTLLRPGQQSNCVAAREPSPRRYPPELLRRLARSAGPSVSLARGRRQHSAKGVGGGLAGASTGLEAASVTPAEWPHCAPTPGSWASPPGLWGTQSSIGHASSTGRTSRLSKASGKAKNTTETLKKTKSFHLGIVGYEKSFRISEGGVAVLDVPMAAATTSMTFAETFQRMSGLLRSYKPPPTAETRPVFRSGPAPLPEERVRRISARSSSAPRSLTSRSFTSRSLGGFLHSTGSVASAPRPPRGSSVSGASPLPPGSGEDGLSGTARARPARASSTGRGSLRLAIPGTEPSPTSRNEVLSLESPSSGRRDRFWSPSRRSIDAASLSADPSDRQSASLALGSLGQDMRTAWDRKSMSASSTRSLLGTSTWDGDGGGGAQNRSEGRKEDNGAGVEGEEDAAKEAEDAAARLKELQEQERRVREEMEALREALARQRAARAPMPSRPSVARSPDPEPRRSASLAQRSFALGMSDIEDSDEDEVEEPFIASTVASEGVPGPRADTAQRQRSAAGSALSGADSDLLRPSLALAAGISSGEGSESDQEDEIGNAGWYAANQAPRLPTAHAEPPTRAEAPAGESRGGSSSVLHARGMAAAMEPVLASLANQLKPPGQAKTSQGPMQAPFRAAVGAVDDGVAKDPFRSDSDDDDEDMWTDIPVRRLVTATPARAKAPVPRNPFLDTSDEEGEEDGKGAGRGNDDEQDFRWGPIRSRHCELDGADASLCDAAPGRASEPELATGPVEDGHLSQAARSRAERREVESETVEGAVAVTEKQMVGVAGQGVDRSGMRLEGVQMPPGGSGQQRSVAAAAERPGRAHTMPAGGGSQAADRVFALGTSVSDDPRQPTGEVNGGEGEGAGAEHFIRKGGTREGREKEGSPRESAFEKSTVGVPYGIAISKLRSHVRVDSLAEWTMGDIATELGSRGSSSGASVRCSRDLPQIEDTFDKSAVDHSGSAMSGEIVAEGWRSKRCAREGGPPSDALIRSLLEGQEEDALGSEDAPRLFAADCTAGDGGKAWEGQAKTSSEKAGQPEKEGGRSGPGHGWDGTGGGQGATCDSAAAYGASHGGESPAGLVGRRAERDQKGSETHPRATLKGALLRVASTTSAISDAVSSPTRRGAARRPPWRVSTSPQACVVKAPKGACGAMSMGPGITQETGAAHSSPSPGTTKARCGGRNAGGVEGTACSGAMSGSQRRRRAESKESPKKAPWAPPGAKVALATRTNRGDVYIVADRRSGGGAVRQGPKSSPGTLRRRGMAITSSYTRMLVMQALGLSEEDEDGDAEGMTVGKHSPLANEPSTPAVGQHDLDVSLGAASPSTGTQSPLPLLDDLCATLFSPSPSLTATPHSAHRRLSWDENESRDSEEHRGGIHNVQVGGDRERLSAVCKGKSSESGVAVEATAQGAAREGRESDGEEAWCRGAWQGFAVQSRLEGEPGPGGVGARDTGAVACEGESARNVTESSESEHGERELCELLEEARALEGAAVRALHILRARHDGNGRTMWAAGQEERGRGLGAGTRESGGEDIEREQAACQNSDRRRQVASELIAALNDAVVGRRGVEGRRMPAGAAATPFAKAVGGVLPLVGGEWGEGLLSKVSMSGWPAGEATKMGLGAVKEGTGALEVTEHRASDEGVGERGEVVGTCDGDCTPAHDDNVRNWCPHVSATRAAKEKPIPPETLLPLISSEVLGSDPPSARSEGHGKHVPLAPALPAKLGGTKGAPAAPALPAKLGGTKGAPAAPALPAKLGGTKGAPAAPALPAKLGGTKGAPAAPALPANLGKGKPPQPRAVGSALAPRPLTRGAPPRRARLKPLHWEKLMAQAGTVWERLVPEAEKASVDWEELERLFAVQYSEAADRLASAQRAAKRVDMGINIVGSRRAHLLGIELSGVKLGLAEVCQAVLAYDASALSGGQLEVLARALPTAEEREELRLYATGQHQMHPGPSDPMMLAAVDRYFLQILPLPRLEHRLKALELCQSGPSRATQLASSLRTVRDASLALCSSASFQTVLREVLAVGNALNQGTARGGASGFRLGFLLSLHDVRASSDRSTSVLHFVLERASEADPAAANLPRDLAGVVGAAGVDLKGVAAGIRELKAQLGRAREEVSAAERLAAQEQEDPGSTVDAELCAVTGLAVPTVAASHGAFVARVRGALGAVEGAVEEASAAEREAREALREASDFFGEGSSGEEMAVLVTVGVFLRHVERALGEMREKAKEEEGWSLRRRRSLIKADNLPGETTPSLAGGRRSGKDDCEPPGNVTGMLEGAVQTLAGTRERVRGGAHDDRTARSEEPHGSLSHGNTPNQTARAAPRGEQLPRRSLMADLAAVARAHMP